MAATWPLPPHGQLTFLCILTTINLEKRSLKIVLILFPFVNVLCLESVVLIDHVCSEVVREKF